jgi:hypothetical protein
MQYLFVRFYIIAKEVNLRVKSQGSKVRRQKSEDRGQRTDNSAIGG